jgi:ATP-binding cassette subfamily B protein
MGFPHFTQPDEMDCGPTCLRIVAKYYGKNFSLPYLRQLSFTTREGSSLLGLSNAAEKIGFKTIGSKIKFEILANEVSLPCIVHWQQSHFIVVYKINKDKVYVSDPGHSLLVYNKQEFIFGWKEGNNEGIVLLLDPTPLFYKEKYENNGLEQTPNFSFIFQYLFKYKKFLIQLIIGLFAGSILQLIVPFLTQSIVDIGIQNHDLNFIYLILSAQLMLFAGRTSIELIRGWILMHISSRINISLVSDFFIKLMKLPISFFDSKMTGDIMQRIADHQRIESFLTSTSLNSLFSFFNLIIFGAILSYYNFTLFIIFFIGSLLYLGWILFFLKRRAAIDYKRFSQMSQNQGKVLELVNGMQEIKLHNAERQKRWSWELIQVRLFKINLKGLALGQTQQVGSSLINELKNILITIYSAKLVIEGQITFGTMLSISYITGQLNSPIQQLVGFIQSLQDARISIDRLSEIHNKADEDSIDLDKINEFSDNTGFTFQNVSFHYSGVQSEFVLKDLILNIPINKITAIVGASGSGKTTLLKMLLKFYSPVIGEIKIGQNDLNNISSSIWREKCGVVMQEGYIFSDTIANNIAIGVDNIDKKRLKYAVNVANVMEFIESLPLNYNTKIGQEGVGLSSGQKQRILIARAVYKNPDYLFFDEATNALDAYNEKIIMNNLNEFFKGKTVVIIAHRLSTVINADQIVVLEKGKIIEVGNHKDLVLERGEYFKLVKNQLELGN